MRVRERVTPGVGTVVSTRPVAKAAKASAAASVDATAETGHAEPVDTASFLGLTETELSPSVKAALQTLLEEVARLRDELHRTRKRIAHLERLADEDAMLPIANRRAFVRELTRIMSYSERYGSPGSVLYFDLNGMKGINDSFGHAAGRGESRPAAGRDQGDADGLGGQHDLALLRGRHPSILRRAIGR